MWPIGPGWVGCHDLLDVMSRRRQVTPQLAGRLNFLEKQWYGMVVVVVVVVAEPRCGPLDATGSAVAIYGM